VRDLRRYSHQTQWRLLVGFILLLFIIGIGLVYVFYGPRAAVLGMICLILGLAPMLLIYLALWGIEWIVKRNNPE
jgi:hypothetical protein